MSKKNGIVCAAHGDLEKIVDKNSMAISRNTDMISEMRVEVAKVKTILFTLLSIVPAVFAILLKVFKVI